jgi:hypothetical protein
MDDGRWFPTEKHFVTLESTERQIEMAAADELGAGQAMSKRLAPILFPQLEGNGIPAVVPDFSDSATQRVEKTSRRTG